MAFAQGAKHKNLVAAVTFFVQEQMSPTPLHLAK
jgi:hypothetical protein